MKRHIHILVFIALCLFPMAAHAGSLTAAAGPITGYFYSAGGAPPGGFLPYSGNWPGIGDRGCNISLAGGNMGDNAAGGANFLMACSTEDQTGAFIKVFQHDHAGIPYTFFELGRDEILRVNGLQVTFPGNGSYPYDTPDEGTRAGAWSAFNFVKKNDAAGQYQSNFSVQTDEVHLEQPAMSVWGYPSSTNTTRTPLVQYYGSSWGNYALSSATNTFQWDGTLTHSFEDNGNHFSNQVVTLKSNEHQTATSTATAIVEALSANHERLSVPVMPNRTYVFRSNLDISTGAGGVRFNMMVTGATAVTGSFWHANCTRNDTGAVMAPNSTTTRSSSFTGSANDLKFVAGTLDLHCILEGTVRTGNSTGPYILSGTLTSGSPTIDMADTTGIVAGQSVVQMQNAPPATACDGILQPSYVVSVVADTSVTMSNNAACSTTSAVRLEFKDTLSVKVGEDTASGTTTVKKFSSLSVDGSINGGAY